MIIILLSLYFIVGLAFARTLDVTEGDKPASRDKRILWKAIFLFFWLPILVLSFLVGFFNSVFGDNR